MTMHLQRDVDRVRKDLLRLGALVKENTQKSIAYLESRNASFVSEILDLEKEINKLEVDIEEECLKILALHQPVAIDLRFIVVVMKVTNDLERMGDQAVNVSQRVTALNEQAPLGIELPLDKMSDVVNEMVSQSLDALVEQDTTLARKVVAMDYSVDEVHAENYQLLKAAVQDKPESVNAAMSYATISSNLERVADLCTNIAEEVICMIEGHIVRHQE